ncbi:MAG: ATP-binding protein [Steroidobacteraceae bacterium]
MRLAVVTSTLAEAGVEAQTSFGMEATSEAFRILSSGLYSDKISAVLREVSCNALDAHVVAGTPDLPIEVQLPTVLDQTLRIRDHGPGLDEKQMVETYTRYFKSDKRESNQLIGGKGLGSKSPFCYVDSFNVTTAQDGEKRMYVAHVGAQGVPVLSLMGRAQADADWPHGLEVSFPVKPKDITEFHIKAPLIFRWFRVLPRIIGGVVIEPVAVALEGETFAIVPPEVSGCRLLMGNVAYPIHRESIPGLTQVEDHLLQNGLILKAPIGSVSPTASREGLEYSPADRAALRKLLAAAMDELRERLKALALQEEATEWLTRRRLHAKLAAAGPGTPSHPVVVKGLFERCAEPLVIREKIMGRLLDTCVKAPGAVGSSGETRVFAYAYHRGREYAVGRSEVIDGAFSDRRRSPLMLRYAHTAMVVVMDVPGSDQRIRFKFRTKGRAWNNATVIGVIGPAALERAQIISEVFGGLKVINASSWPAPEKPKKEPSGKVGGLKEAGVKHYARAIRGIDNPQGRGAIKLGVPSEDVDPADLDESGKYFIVARDIPRKCSEFLNRTETSGRYIPVDVLGALWGAYEEARCQGVDLPLIEGVLVLETAQPCRSLEKEGWRDLVVAMRERLIEKREQAVRGFFEVPNLWSKHEVHCSWYPMHQYGAAAVLANLETSSRGWKACEPIVAARPTFARWVRELRSLKEGLRGDGSDVDKRQVSLREALNVAGALLGQMHEARWSSLDLIGDKSIEQKRFPRLALLNAAWMQKVLGDDEAAASCSDVAVMLQAALSLEIEV